MKIILSTPIKNLTVSSQTKKFWNDTLMSKYNQSHDRYSSFSRSEKLPNWDKVISSDFRVFDVFEKLNDFYKKESYDLTDSKGLDAIVLSFQMIDLFKKDGLDITNVFLGNQLDDSTNSGGWRYSEFISMYLNYLDYKKELIPNSIFEQYFLELEEQKKYYSYVSIDENIKTYFTLLSVIPQKEITHDWFVKKLDFFCTIKDEDSRELINQYPNLNFDSQKQIYNYVNNYFPECINEDNKYFSQLLPSPIFSTKRLYQSSIEINLYQILNQNNLNQKDLQHLNNIAKECLNVISGSNFMNLINENINVSNIFIAEKNSNLILNFSTDSFQNLETFEKIALRSLNGVFQFSDKIRISWSDSYSGENEIITNMDANFIHQHYLYQNLNETLETSNHKPKKMKI